MARPDATSRRFILFTLAGAVAMATGCAPPEPPPPPPPILVVSSIAAVVPVVNVDRQGREMLMQGRDGIFGVVAGSEARSLGRVRPGSRLLVEYSEDRPARLGPAPRNVALNRLPITIQGIEPGGGRFLASGLPGGTQALVVEDRAMAAFVTRLGVGADASVTIRQVPVGGT